MRDLVTGKDKLCKDITDALGLKHCRKLNIKMEVKKNVTIEAECYPDIDGVKQLIPILKKYELIEKSKKQED